MSYKEEGREYQTDESKQIAHSTYHQNLIGLLIWLASLAGINIRRTYFNNPKGDAKAKDADSAIKFAVILRERYYQYNSVDLTDLNDIEFRNRAKTDGGVVKAVVAKGIKKWYITTGSIVPSAKLKFEQANIRYLEYTSKAQVLEYLRRSC
jgi:hypothetical protein